MALPILDGNQTATTLSTILTGGQHIPAHTVVSLGSQAITDMRSAVSGSVVSISNFPASQTISGTVTANLTVEALVNTQAGIASDAGGAEPSHGVQIGYYDASAQEFTLVDTSNPLPISGTVTVGNSVTIGSLPAISGTVTANQPSEKTSSSIYSVGSDKVSIVGGVWWDQSNYIATPIRVGEEGEVFIGSLPAISGTVTANNPSGALTTRFGSVTTANTAQLTSAVTNTSRKYLLVQNIATSTVTIGIGFAPTTTQGIQLTAGAGLTFDAFCPTGGVWWLSSTTGSNFSILEG